MVKAELPGMKSVKKAVTTKKAISAKKKASK